MLLIVNLKIQFQLLIRSLRLLTQLLSFLNSAINDFNAHYLKDQFCLAESGQVNLYIEWFANSFLFIILQYPSAYEFESKS
jgi:hypothetical protein